ncbi:MAG TPA: carboxypeptidase regulatory-like domain-containing protein [Gemmatimonadaceae bacterium]|nr:carboxypeptidase regulatory-like domain-containing protein [Gemmatimonadaceae bacterium]
MTFTAHMLTAQTTKPKPNAPQTPAPAPAPAPNAGNPVSGAVGVVGDSIHGGPLVGAVVEVVGTGRKGTTDTSGRFRIDSIPPGGYKLTMSHPLLDSLGVAIQTNEVQFPAGRYALIALATPSPTTITNTFCPAEKQRTGPGIVLGQVRDADTDVPSTGAKVSMAWTQFMVGKTIGFHPILRQRESIVDANGNYRICGVPAGTKAAVRATYKGLATADIPVNFSDGTIQLVTFHTALPDTAPPPPVIDTTPTVATSKTPAPAAPKATVVGLRTGHATLTGRVVNAADKGLPNADVQVIGAASKTQTDSNGNFTLRNLPSGTQTLMVRKLAFAPQTQPVDLSSKATQTARVLMAMAPPTLAQVKVTATGAAKGLADVGFDRRKKMGLGHFLTRDQIEEKIPTYMTDIFTTMPGIHVDYSSGQPVLTGSRGTTGSGCVNYVVDGTPYSEATPGDINDFMHPNEVEAVEVYSDVDTPAEYAKPGQSCETIVIWTKTRTGDLK